MVVNRYLQKSKGKVFAAHIIFVRVSLGTSRSERFASNIKHSRAETTVDTLSEYFEQRSESANENVLRNCVWNYVETNICDGRTKYPETLECYEFQ